MPCTSGAGLFKTRGGSNSSRKRADRNYLLMLDECLASVRRNALVRIFLFRALMTVEIFGCLGCAEYLWLYG